MTKKSAAFETMPIDTDINKEKRRPRRSYLLVGLPLVGALFGAVAAHLCHPARGNKAPAHPPVVSSDQINFLPDLTKEFRGNPSAQQRLNDAGNSLGQARGTIELSFQQALASPLYHYAQQSKPDAAQGALAALAGAYAAQEENAQIVKRKNKDAMSWYQSRAAKLMAIKKILTVFNLPRSRQTLIIDRTLDALNNDKGVPGQTTDGVAYRAWNAALEPEYNQGLPPAPKNKIVPIRDVIIVPPAIRASSVDPKTHQVIVKVNGDDVMQLATICSAEANIIDRMARRDSKADQHEGQESCVAALTNRAAEGNFGANIRQVIDYGGFEAKSVLPVLPAPSADAVESTRTIVHQRIFNWNFGGVTAFQNTDIDRGAIRTRVDGKNRRYTDYGTAAAFIKTVGNRESGVFHDLYAGRLLLKREISHDSRGLHFYQAGTVLLYPVPDYRISVIEPVKSRHRRGRLLAGNSAKRRRAEPG